MSVERIIRLRILTDLDYFSEVAEVLLNNGLVANEDGTITSLSENDIDDFDYIIYDSFDNLRQILNKRQDKGLSNYVIMWLQNREDSLLVRSDEVENVYKGVKHQYELTLFLGHGIRVIGADRYTDFGIYLNKILPIFVNHSMYICEVNCSDFDC